MNLFLAFFCNVLVNGFLMFLTYCLLVEVLLFIFQIKNIRISLFARLIPMLKLVMDFSLYKYSSWALWNDINPFLAEKYSRSLDVGYFFDSGIFPWLLPTITLHIKKTLSFSVGDIFYLLLEPNVVFFLCMFVLSISVILLFKYLLGSRNTYREKREFFPKISNPSIKKKLLEFKVRFYITNGLHSPFVEGIRNPAIYFPKNAQTLYSLEPV